jgi:isoleucyl-tRNA synthetase
VATWGTLDYPSSEEEFDDLWPADLIIEAHDQTRGWFWSQLGMGTAAVGEVPYEQVLMHGFANDSDGRKMSKSLGNIVTPQEAIERFGRDPLRAYLLSHNQHGEDLAFEWEGLGETQSKLNIFWNVFRFPLSYMALDGYDPAAASLSDGDLTTVDEWVLSRLQSVEREVEEAWAEYRVHDALTSVLEFVTADVSRFYVKAIRERMWEEQDSASKRGAYATLATVLDEVIRLLAPFTPYLAERMYQRLDGAATTVHQLSAPEPDETLHRPELEEEMAVLRQVEEAAANARQQGGRKLRWPVSRVVVESEDSEVRAAVDSLRDLLSERVNARAVEVCETFDELVDYAEPQMGVIGPEFGAAGQDIMAAVGGATREELGDLTVEVDGEEYELTPEMVEWRSEAPAHVSAADFESGTVYVDTELDEELESEGYARDVVRRVQEMRKRLDLAVDERIHTAVDVADDRVSELVERHRDLIAEETRTEAFVDSAEGMDLVEEWEVEGVPMTIGIDRLEAAEPAA